MPEAENTEGKTGSLPSHIQIAFDLAEEMTKGLRKRLTLIAKDLQKKSEEVTPEKLKAALENTGFQEGVAPEKEKISFDQAYLNLRETLPEKTAWADVNEIMDAACKKGSIAAIKFLLETPETKEIVSEAPSPILLEALLASAKASRNDTLLFLREEGILKDLTRRGYLEMVGTIVRNENFTGLDIVIDAPEKPDFNIKDISVFAPVKNMSTAMILKLVEKGLAPTDPATYISSEYAFDLKYEFRACINDGNEERARAIALAAGSALNKEWADTLDKKSKSYFNALCVLDQILPPGTIDDPEFRQRQKWEKAGMPDVINQGKDPDGVSASVFNAALKALKIEHLDTIPRTSLGYIAYNTGLLFSSEEQLEQYFKKWAQRGKQPLHDILYMITIPQDALKDIDLKAWSDAILKHGPAMAKLIKFADKLPAPVKAADGTWSLRKTRETIGQYVYKRAHEMPNLAGLFFKHDMSEKEFDIALDIVSANISRNHASTLPKITIRGEDFGMPGAAFKRLEDNDPRGLILGELTDCCQSIGGHGHDCAVHGFTSKNGGFYVVAANDNTPEEEIIGQAWGWRGKDDTLVLDTLETLGNRVNTAQWTSILKAFAEAVDGSKTDITALHVGTGGGTPEKLPFNKAAKPAMPKNYEGYRESEKQLEIWRRKNRDKKHP